MPRQPITRKRPYTPRGGSLAGQTFASERQYRNALARKKGFRSWAAQQRASTPVRTLTALRALPPRQRDIRIRALEALSDMRAHATAIKAAARAAGTTPNTVRKYVGSALRKDTRGRFTATASDRLYREMRFLTPRGEIVLGVTDSRTASRIAHYSNAVRRYLTTGDTRGLREFRRTGVRAQKVYYPFVTDPRTLDRLANANEVSFEDLYARAA